jgi:hypothetical protein
MKVLADIRWVVNFYFVTLVLENTQVSNVCQLVSLLTKGNPLQYQGSFFLRGD